MSYQPHLVSLVLQSKKALQHGEQLCSRAKAITTDSAKCSMDILELDAKVKWLTIAVLEQLKLAMIVVKCIEQKHAHLKEHADRWDAERIRRTDALDAILESLGTHLVPPDFHQGSSGSSLFGSQHSTDEWEEEREGRPRGARSGGGGSRTAPIRIPRGGANANAKGKGVDKRSWKSLRHFVDERAIENVYETIEQDRTALDDVLARTHDYPESLAASITTIRSSLPPASTSPPIKGILLSQEAASASLASHLESLAAHYDQMARAVKESEAGEGFSEEDMRDMNRDTEELPAIMAELEESAMSIEESYKELCTAREVVQQQLDSQRSTLNDLEELGDIMAEVLRLQEGVEIDVTERLEGLQRHLLTIEDLHHQYESYQIAFCKLLLELARRKQYREGAELIVKRMATQLESMIEEESQLRNEFNAAHGQYLPTDLCLCVEDPPTKWEILPYNGEREEALPHIDDDLLIQARERLSEVDKQTTFSPESL